MSWEGYAQVICQNGHLHGNWTPKATSALSSASATCPTCNAEPGFVNIVDDTNGDRFGLIREDDLKTLLTKEAAVQRCNLGHDHVIVEAQYRIPTPEEAKRLRSYYDQSLKRFRKLSLRSRELRSNSGYY